MDIFFGGGSVGVEVFWKSLGVVGERLLRELVWLDTLKIAGGELAVETFG